MEAICKVWTSCFWTRNGEKEGKTAPSSIMGCVGSPVPWLRWAKLRLMACVQIKKCVSECVSVREIYQRMLCKTANVNFVQNCNLFQTLFLNKLVFNSNLQMILSRKKNPNYKAASQQLAVHSFAPEFIKLSTSDCAPVCSVQCSGATAQGGSIMIKRRTRRLSHAITLHYGSQDFKVKMNGSSSTWRLHISSFFSLFVSFFFLEDRAVCPPPPPSPHRFLFC